MGNDRRLAALRPYVKGLSKLLSKREVEAGQGGQLHPRRVSERIGAVLNNLVNRSFLVDCFTSTSSSVREWQEVHGRNDPMVSKSRHVSGAVMATAIAPSLAVHIFQPVMSRRMEDKERSADVSGGRRSQYEQYRGFWMQ